jgi:4-phospho-D-threonate 3-dehydrogenase / 4-phospho-D-erythronate 3-dehydrogenase
VLNLKNIIVVTMGDPNGVGPEICVRLAARPKENRKLVFLGDAQVFKQAAELLKLDLDIHEFSAWQDLAFAKARMCVFNNGAKLATAVRPGVICAKAGRFALQMVRLGVELCQNEQALAMVTAPICKEAVELEYSGFQGHTEFIGELCGDPEPVLALVHKDWVVAHVSTHVSLREAADRYNKERIIKTANALHVFLQRYKKIPQPRLILAGLNPHAGEAGLFGREELDEALPAVSVLQGQGMQIKGPLPGDVVFPQLKAKWFDGAVAAYHDQGHVVTKTLAFALGKSRVLRGVNTTLGISVLRTSVDHGTAFDIAWQGKTSDASLQDALHVARKLVFKG